MQNKQVLPIRSKEKVYTRFKDILLNKMSPELRDLLLSMKRFHFWNGKTAKEEKMLIQLVDGRDYQGGLTDRMKGIVSAFCVAQIKKRTFKIRHFSPFELYDYLEPNEIDWVIRDERVISSNIFQAQLYHLTKSDGLVEVAKRIERPNNILQMHCYCKGELYQILEKNDDWSFDWGKEFKRLFKPKQDLKEHIDICKTQIGGSYIAAVFRFQNLLGDFEEYNYPTASQDRQKRLIEKCSDAIVHLQQTEYTKKILVTSDSIRFLEHLKGLMDVYVFPERVVHMDWVQNESYQTYLKSFLDFYLIADAIKVFSIGTKEMYKSDFPKYAAMVNGIPFKRISVAG